MASVPFGHHELHNRYRFQGTLELVTPLRLSSGQANDDTDAPLMRARDGVPYIPGSSLRGAIRSEVERILAAVGDAVGLSSCTLFSKGDESCVSVSRSKQQQIVECENEAQALMLAKDNSCDVCKLFGSTVLASRLIIEDSLPVREMEKLCDKSVIRDGVGIDRDTGTAVDGAKFNYEVLEKGPEFSFFMQAENAGGQDRKILDVILNLLGQGLYVGGKRAGGLGRIRLRTGWTVTGFENPQELWKAIMNGEDPHKTLTWKESQLC